MLGYMILSENTIQVKLDKSRWYLFGGFVALTVFNLLFQNVWDCSSGIVYDIFSGFLSWIGILSIIGIGKHYLDFHNKVTNYFTKASFPIYIFHQSWLVLIAYYTFKITSSIVLQVIVIIAGSFILTIFTYEIFKRTPITRFLFGIKE
ncbi:MAG: hypothetical protein ACERKV_07955 [Clostridiaceae bacterium]